MFRILAICALVVGLCGGVVITHLKTQVDSLQRENGTLVASLEALNTAIEDRDHNEGEADSLAQTRRDMRADLRAMMQEISNAPETDDAPLSAGMLDTLDRLREYHADHFGAASADPGRVQELRRPDAPAADDDAARASPVVDAGSGRGLDVLHGRAKAGSPTLTEAVNAADKNSDDRAVKPEQNRAVAYKR